ncbi:hypothetical protein MG293_001726 [Ovis ammon polii]|uniref:Uncharacterized protein n=1 Tax=Ovis ammon polii TaxID=230172 RepID=A0AAD4UNL3_OVIAM|nr:hypothetical protein MG293_001726 [Ovis ammon polii]
MGRDVGPGHGQGRGIQGKKRHTAAAFPVKSSAKQGEVCQRGPRDGHFLSVVEYKFFKRRRRVQISRNLKSVFCKAPKSRTNKAKESDILPDYSSPREESRESMAKPVYKMKLSKVRSKLIERDTQSIDRVWTISEIIPLCIFFPFNFPVIGKLTRQPFLTYVYGTLLLNYNIRAYYSFAVWDRACQDPLAVGFTRQEYWRGLPLPSPGDLPDPRVKPAFPALQVDSLPSEPPEKPHPDVSLPCNWTPPSTNSGAFHTQHINLYQKAFAPDVLHWMPKPWEPTEPPSAPERQRSLDPKGTRSLDYPHPAKGILFALYPTGEKP